jgi:hypothetical protein
MDSQSKITNCWNFHKFTLREKKIRIKTMNNIYFLLDKIYYVNWWVGGLMEEWVGGISLLFLFFAATFVVVVLVVKSVVIWVLILCFCFTRRLHHTFVFDNFDNGIVIFLNKEEKYQASPSYFFTIETSSKCLEMLRSFLNNFQRSKTQNYCSLSSYCNNK